MRATISQWIRQGASNGNVVFLGTDLEIAPKWRWSVKNATKSKTKICSNVSQLHKLQISINSKF